MEMAVAEGAPASPEWPRFALVEAFGLPGAGKTALCLKLVQDLGAGTVPLLGERFRKEWKTRRWWQRKLLVGWSALTSPRLALELLKLALRYELWRKRRTFAHLARLPVVRSRIERSPEPLLLDQAMLQDVWSTFVSAGHTEVPADAIVPLLSQLYRRVPVHVLYLDLHVAAAAERISRREGGKSTFDGLPQATTAKRLAEVEALAGSIVEAARLAGLPVIHLDASQPRSAVLSTARAALEITSATLDQRVLPQ